MLNQKEKSKSLHSESSLEEIKVYYGKVLQSNKDLKTSACCPVEAMSPRIRSIVKEIHPEVLEKFYGCGSPIPPTLKGLTVLDLGSGSGRDSFILAKLVGPDGKVIGVDMTKNQIETAKRHVDYHMKKFGHSQSNTSFCEGYIEDLESLGIENDSIDLVVSNCVLNLSPHKRRVFSEIFRVLKPGGELYFSDVFASRRIPENLAKDQVLLGECLGGALYFEDFRRLMNQVGVFDYRVVSQGPISLTDPEIDRKIGMIEFSSLTVRAFKLPLEDRCEDYGQVAWYLGTIPECPHTFILDDHHIFQVSRPMLICGNTADMLSQTRFAPHFIVKGDKSTHLGLFDCGITSSSSSSTGIKGKNSSGSGACC